MDDVVVLGAGVAGLACAAALSSAGRSVQVMEARDRVGGRILTLRPPGAPLPVEVGAEFVHGAPPELMTLLAEAGATPVPVVDEFWSADPDGLRPAARYDEDLEHALDAMDARRDPDRSVADFLRAWAGERPGRERAARRAWRFVEGFHAADAERASEAAIAHETAAAAEEGEQDYRLPAGYDTVPRWLRSRLGDGVAVHLGTAARRVRWSRGAVTVETRVDGADGPTLRARAAVLALPIALLQAAAGEVGAVALDPLPPAKARALAHLATGDARRIVLRFRERLWEDDARRAPGVREPLAALGFLQADDAAVPVWWPSAPLREPVITGWLGGPRASRLAGASDEAVVALAVDALAAALRLPRAELEAQLEAAHTYDWAADPYARGAYSYALVGAGDARQALAAPVDDTLFWAGEATHAAGSAGTVHGALASGYRAAGEVIAALG